jgi:alkanesulfonate monooxygenase SsuD/methylene tetrahydromethanopterin reductase-like flavin-dependent oxidoreductase (luciferase family)
MATLTAAAAVTERIRLATSVIIGPLRNTASLAKMAASLDLLSEGRLTLGISIGARADDYETAGIPYQQRGRRLTQQLAELRDHWENPALGPTPVQPGGPPVLVGGNSDQAFGRVVQFAAGYFHGGGPPIAFSRMAEKARAAWRDGDRPGRPQLWGMAYFALGDHVAEPGANYLRDYYAFTGPFAERIAQGLLTTPQSITQFIRGYADAGCDELVLFPTSADVAQLERLSDVLG